MDFSKFQKNAEFIYFSMEVDGVFPVVSEGSPEKKESNKRHLDEIAKMLASEISNVTPEAQKLNEQLAISAKSFFENLENLSEEEKKDLRDKAAQQSIFQLQGWEWMGLDESNAEGRYLKLSQAFLSKEINDDGQQIFRVKAELDHSENTRMGIGAGHLLPPSIQRVEITDNQGVKRVGIRKIMHGEKVGYYDDKGNYLAIFGGYKIRPLAFIDENSDEYKNQIKAEVENYKNLQSVAAAVYPDGTGSGSKYARTLTELENADEKTLKSGEASEVEIQNILAAKEDWIRIRSILNSAKMNVKVSPSVEFYGPSYLLDLNGEGAKILGWSESETQKRNEVFAKLSDQEYLNENLKNLKEGEEKTLEYGLILRKSSSEKGGYEFRDKNNSKVNDLRSWSAKLAVEGMKPSKTAELIKAMSDGGEFAGYKFAGNYEFNIADLKRLNSLNESQKDSLLNKSLEKAKNGNGLVEPSEFLKIAFMDTIPGAGLSVDELRKYLDENPNLDWLGDKDWKCPCCRQSHVGMEALLRAAGQVKVPIQSVNYDWEVHREKTGLGPRQCARTVSDILGLNGRYKSVTSTLAPALIEANLRKTGKTGVVFGFENYREGDVIIWRGGRRGAENYGHNRFSHTSIVRHVMEIGGEKYFAMQHDAADLVIDLVPVNQNPRNLKNVQKAVSARNVEALVNSSSDPAKLRSQFNDIFWYRPNGRVRVKHQRDGAKMRDATLAFAIRTSTLQNRI